MARHVTLPDGTRIRGRGLRDGPVPGPAPDFGLYLGTARLRRRHESSLAWPHTWIAWPDFLLPLDSSAAITAIRALHRRARDGERVEVACNGGVGRTGASPPPRNFCLGLRPSERCGQPVDCGWLPSRYP